MANTVKVKLTNPITLHDKQIDFVELKEPTGGLYMQLGEPSQWVHMKSGGGYMSEVPEIIEKYLHASIQHELKGDLVKILSLIDAIAVKGALLGFFSVAEAALLRNRSTTSSSASAQ
jgi:hypothetical protein